MDNPISPQILQRSSSLTTLGGKIICDDADVIHKRATLEAMDWILKTLGVLSAIVFGVWAPISYKLAQDGNASNNEAQKQLLEAQRALIDEMREMRRQQSALVEAMGRMASTLYKLGEFESWSYCQKDQNSTICSDTDGANKLDILLMNINDHPRMLLSSSSIESLSGIASTSRSERSQSSTSLQTEPFRVQVISVSTTTMRDDTVPSPPTDLPLRFSSSKLSDNRYFSSAGFHIVDDNYDVSEFITISSELLSEAKDVSVASHAHRITSSGLEASYAAKTASATSSTSSNIYSRFAFAPGCYPYNYSTTRLASIEDKVDLQGPYAALTSLLPLVVIACAYYGVDIMIYIFFRLSACLSLHHTRVAGWIAKGSYSRAYVLAIILAITLIKNFPQ